MACRCLIVYCALFGMVATIPVQATAQTGPAITSYGDNYPGSGESLTFTERFTRTGPETIEYKYTVDDPKVYVRPYTVAHDLTLDNAFRISYEICHEGHDDMPSALASGRVDEVTSIDNANDTRLQREPRLKQEGRSDGRGAEDSLTAILILADHKGTIARR